MSNEQSIYTINHFTPENWKNMYRDFAGVDPACDKDLQDFKSIVQEQLESYSGVQKIAKVLNMWEISGFMSREEIMALFGKK